MENDQPESTVTARDRRLVEQYLGAFLLVLLKAGPNSAVADNARRAAEEMVAKERERCARRVERFFAPCSATLERRYGIELAGHIREGT